MKTCYTLYAYAPHFPYIQEYYCKSIQIIYLDVIKFSKIWRMMAHAHAVCTRPSFLSPSEGLGTRPYSDSTVTSSEEV